MGCQERMSAETGRTARVPGGQTVSRARIAILFFVLTATTTVPCLAQSAGQLLAEADALYDRWSDPFDFDAYQADLAAAIDRYEQALPLIPDDASHILASVLNRLARACFELGAAYLSDRDDLETVYRRGKDYALASLRLDPAFRETEAESFRAALAGASDAEAVFWYGNVFGRYVEFHPLTALMGGMADIKTSFERAIELDEALLAGGPWRAYASFLAQVPEFLGGDMDAAFAAHERALEIGPLYLENAVNFADFVLEPQEDWSRFCAVLTESIDQGGDPDVVAEWPLYNTLALRRASELLAQHPCDNG